MSSLLNVDAEKEKVKMKKMISINEKVKYVDIVALGKFFGKNTNARKMERS